MGSRSRSRSPPPMYSRRERRRSRSRDRDRDKDRRRIDRHRSRTPPRHRRSRSRSPVHRKRSRSISPIRDRSRSRERNRDGQKNPKVNKLVERPQITEADLEGKTEDEIEMMKLMGFSAFDTTKGKHVSGNTTSAVNIIHKRKYRQYMNRKGGFNRPLDFVA